MAWLIKRLEVNTSLFLHAKDSTGLTIRDWTIWNADRTKDHVSLVEGCMWWSMDLSKLSGLAGLGCRWRSPFCDRCPALQLLDEWSHTCLRQEVVRRKGRDSQALHAKIVSATSQGCITAAEIEGMTMQLGCIDGRFDVLRGLQSISAFAWDDLYPAPP